MPKPTGPPIAGPTTEESFLTPEERKQMQRFLGYPEEFPRKFGSWIADYIAVNGLEIPASQIRGINQFRPSVAVLATTTNITSTTYVSGGGPSLTLGTGTYLLLYGFQFAQNIGTGDGYGLASPSVSGGTPGDGDAARTKYLLGSTNAISSSDQTEGSCIFFKTATFTEATNTVELKYRVTNGNLNFINTYLIAIKLSN